MPACRWPAESVKVYPSVVGRLRTAIIAIYSAVALPRFSARSAGVGPPIQFGDDARMASCRPAPARIGTIIADGRVCSPGATAGAAQGRLKAKAS